MIGDVLKSQGNRQEALKSYQTSKDIIDRLVASDPGNAPWQRHLWISYTRIGDALRFEGNFPEALQYYLRATGVTEQLVQLNRPGIAGGPNS